MQVVIRRNTGSGYNLSICRARVGINSQLGSQANRRRVTDTGVAVDLVGDGVDGPELASIAVVLATQVDNLVLECLLTIPTISRNYAAIPSNFPASVDTKEGDIIRTIAKLPRAVHHTNSDPVSKSLARAKIMQERDCDIHRGDRNNDRRSVEGTACSHSPKARIRSCR